MILNSDPCFFFPSITCYRVFSSNHNMLSLTEPPLTPNQSQNRASPMNQVVVPKQAKINQPNLAPDVHVPYINMRKVRDEPMIRRPRRTNPMVWFAAIVCLIFSLLLIFLGIAVLIIFLAVKPRNPVFDTTVAALNVIYFDSPGRFNGDFSFLANFTNPNRKLDVRFEFAEIELYFSDSLVATQKLSPFTQRHREARVVPIHMISSLVYMPTNVAQELVKQVQKNRVIYNIRGTFRVKANLGLFHYSYWLHGRCELQMTGPPTGVLINRICKTHR